MNLKELKSDERLHVYNNYLINDFHKSEVKPLDLIEHLIEEGKYKCYGFYEEQDLLGYAYFVNSKESILMDYLAVNAEHRCRGLGSKFISVINEEFSKDYATLLSEVENPKYALDETDRCNRERRISFYMKNNFELTNIETRVLEDEYMIIKFKLNRELNIDEINREINAIYETIFGEEFFNKHIDILETI